MTDITLDRYLVWGTDAERLAFTPDPGVAGPGTNILPIWVVSDVLGFPKYFWDTATGDWAPWVVSGGSSRQLWQYRAKTGATSGYPGDGRILWNNATQTSATALLFSHLTDDGLDIDLFFSFLASGDTIILQDQIASADYQEWSVSGAPVNTNAGLSNSYWTIPVTLSASGGAGTTGFTNNERLIAVVFAAGSGGGGITEFTGDVTAGPGSGSQAATIAANVVSNSKFRQSGALAVVGRSANSTGDVADIQATAASGAVLRESGSTIGFGTIGTAGIANSAVTLAKIANQADQTILGNNTGGSAAPLALTAAQVRTVLSLVIGTDVQAYSANLTTYAGIAPSANVQSFLGAANYSAMRTQLGLVIGTDVQAYSANLTTYAGITPSANVQSFLGAANYAAMRTQLTLVVGTDVQAYSANLAALAALSTTGKIYYLSAANTWTAVTIGSGLTFSAGTLDTAASVTSFNTRTGAVTLTSGDVTGALGFTPLDAAASSFGGSAAKLTTVRNIAMTGDVAWNVNFDGSAAVTAAGTIQNSAVTLAKIANIADQTILGNNTGGSAAPVALTAAQTRTVLGFVKDNFSATSAPTVNDDSSAGYAVGSIWVWGANGQAWMLRDASVGAAVWVQFVGEAGSYLSGQWYCCVRSITTGPGNALTNGTIRLQPFRLMSRVKISQLSAQVTTVSASGNVQLAIYANDPATNLPTGAALATTPSLPTTGLGTVSSALSGGDTWFDSGIYWMAVNSDNATNVMQTIPNANSHAGALVGAPTPDNAAANYHIAVTQTYGTWPSLTGATRTITLSARSALLYFKVA